VAEQQPLNPLIILYNTDATQDDAIFETAFHKQNYSEEYTLTEFREKFKVTFRVGPRMPDCHRVIEVHPELRDKLLKAPRLFVGYRSTRARDYLRVLKCYKCHDYGHVQKYCTSVEQLRGTCGEKQHEEGTTCPLKNEDLCVSCLKRGNRIKHRNQDCPGHKLALSKLKGKFNYRT